MNEAEFDQFADEYYAMHVDSIAASGEGPEYFAEYKIIDIAREVSLSSHQPTGQLDILDFGAGIGGSIRYVNKHFPNAKLTCLDLSQRSLAVAEKRFPKLASYTHFDGSKIPFDANSFDIAYAMCVFHHIDHDEHVSLLEELRRIIRPGGRLFIFEHNPYNPLTVKVVNSCPFDANARLIKGAQMKARLRAAGFAGSKLNYRIFFPRALKAFRPLEMALKWLPLGGQYYSMSVK